MTDTLELQRRLVAKLGEQIYLENDGKFYWHNVPKVSNRFGDQPVRRTEWDYIVRMVEEGLHPNQQVDYIAELEQSFRREENKHFDEDPEKKFPFNEFGRFAVVHASWQQRAAAMVECGII